MGMSMMRHTLQTGTVLLAAGALACCAGGSTAPLVCTAGIAYGIRAVVRDSVTDRAIGSGSTAVAVGIGVRDSVSAPANMPALDNTIFTLVPEKAGTYELNITHAGYARWQRSGIVVTKDACHVIPVDITARLVQRS